MESPPNWKVLADFAQIPGFHFTALPRSRDDL